MGSSSSRARLSMETALHGNATGNTSGTRLDNAGTHSNNESCDEESKVEEQGAAKPEFATNADTVHLLAKVRSCQAEKFIPP